VRTQTIHGQQDRADKRRGSTKGEWWRFDRYEIERGCIRPAAGARLESYDPWQEFLQSHKETRGQPPYRDLVVLMEKAKMIPGIRVPHCLSDESQSLILSWCRRYGLLGVLLSRWEQVRLAAQGLGSDNPVQRRYVRAFGDSVEVSEISIHIPDLKAVALIHGLDDLVIHEEPLGKTWAHFFPSVPFEQRETFPYPVPYSDEFCRLYAEPLDHFYLAAKRFTDAIPLVGRKQSASDLPSLYRTLDVLDILRRPVNSVLEWHDDGRLTSRTVAPSLLASFVEMFAQDQAFDRPTLECACCHTPFVSSSYLAQYCSLACRYRQQKRNVRQKIRQARDLRKQGHKVRQIAAALDVQPQLVKHWLSDTSKR
jgi:hypothetical protein